MSWLKTLIDERLANLPKDAFVDRTFGFGDIRAVVELVESALKQHADDTAAAGREAALKAARDPFHDHSKHPGIFTSMAGDFWRTEMTFPRVFRNALLIAIYSHTEALLLSWCESASPDSNDVKQALKKKQLGETTPHRYLRYLRDDVGLALGDFTQWPEWAAMDAYRRARNCLAHEAGIVDQDDAPKIASLPNIQVDQSGLLESKPVVHLLPGACEAAADAAKAFIGRAVAALDLAGR